MTSNLETPYSAAITTGTSQSALETINAAVVTSGTPARRTSAVSATVLRSAPTTWPPALPSVTAATNPVHAFLASTVMPDELSQVQSWVDQGSGRKDASPPTATTPSPFLLRNAAPNGTKPVLSFDGTDDSMHIVGSDANSATQTILSVVRPSTLSNYRMFWGSAADGGLQFYLDSTGRLFLSKQNIAAIGNSGYAVGANQWVVLAATVTATTWTIYVNGYSVASGTHSQTLSGGSYRIIGAMSNLHYYAGTCYAALAWNRDPRAVRRGRDREDRQAAGERPVAIDVGLPPRRGEREARLVVVADRRVGEEHREHRPRELHAVRDTGS